MNSALEEHDIVQLWWAGWMRLESVRKKRLRAEVIAISIPLIEGSVIADMIVFELDIVACASRHSPIAQPLIMWELAP